MKNFQILVLFLHLFFWKQLMNGGIVCIHLYPEIQGNEWIAYATQLTLLNKGYTNVVQIYVQMEVLQIPQSIPAQESIRPYICMPVWTHRSLLFGMQEIPYLSWLLYDIPCTPKVWHLQGEYYMNVIIKEWICIRMVGWILGCFSTAVDFAVFLCEILSLSYRISPPVKWACKVLWALRVFTRCKKNTSIQTGEPLFALFSFVKNPLPRPFSLGNRFVCIIYALILCWKMRIV